jgi:hypothetical protein
LLVVIQNILYGIAYWASSLSRALRPSPHISLISGRSVSACH